MGQDKPLKPMAPMILEGLVKVGSPLGTRIDAVVSMTVEAGIGTEQWFTFTKAGVTIEVEDWGTFTTGVWGNRLPFTPANIPSDGTDLRLSKWHTDTPDAATFFDRMKAAIVAANAQAGYSIARYTTAPLGANPPDEVDADDAAPLFRERLYDVLSDTEDTTIQFAANHLEVGQPGPTPQGWVRRRMLRALWRHTKAKFPPEAVRRSEALHQEPLDTTASEWWTDRRAKLDPDNNAGDLTYARFWVYEYRFTDWSQLAAPPNP